MIGIGISLNTRRGGGAGGGIAPGLSGTISNTTFTQGTGTTTYPTSGGFTGSALTYALENGINGFAIPGMTINSSTGVITVDRATAEVGTWYPRVTASSAFGPDVYQDFEVFVRYQTVDFTVTNDAQWVTALATATAGQKIGYTGSGFATVDLPARTLSPRVIITALSVTSGISLLTANASDAFDFIGARFQHESWPYVGNSLLRGSGVAGAVNSNFKDCKFRHGYGPTLANTDPTIVIPETVKAALEAGRTASAASSRFALTHRDVALARGYITVVNTGATSIFVKTGNSTVTATTGDTLVTAGNFVRIDMSGTVPTHIAAITASGTSTYSTQSEQGLASYQITTFSATGLTRFSASFERCQFFDVMNAAKTVSLNSMFDCDVQRVYQDVISASLNTSAVSFQYVVRNRFGLPFSDGGHAENPHGDVAQWFNTGGTLGQNCIMAGNITWRQTAIAHAGQGFFASDNLGGYQKNYVVSNLFLGGSYNGIILENAGSGHDPLVTKDNYIFANTVAQPTNADTNTGITNNGVPERVFLAKNIGNFHNGATSEAAGLNNFLTNATKDAIFTNWSLLNTARGYKAMLTAYQTIVSSGAKWGDQFIDWTTRDPASVVKWNLLPVGLSYAPVANAAKSTLVTTPIKRVMGGPTSSTVNTILAGTEWQTSTDELGASVVQAWTSGTGVVARGNYIQFRGTTSASDLTSSTWGATINGEAITASYRTLLAAPAVFLTSTGGYLRSPTNPGGTLNQLTFSGKFYFPSFVDNAAIFSQQAGQCDLQFDGTGGNIKMRVENSAGVAQIDVPNFGVGFAINQWYQIDWDVNAATPLVTLTINGDVRTYTPPSAFTLANNRPVGFMAYVGGTFILPSGTRVADLSVSYNGVLAKAISNTAATANADAWKLPVSPTSDFT